MSLFHSTRGPGGAVLVVVPIAASVPASDPLNLGVGGTSLTADLTTGEYKSETVWNESIPFGAAGGGGFSTIFRKPAYQHGVVPGKYRGGARRVVQRGHRGRCADLLGPAPVRHR